VVTETAQQLLHGTGVYTGGACARAVVCCAMLSEHACSALARVDCHDALLDTCGKVAVLMVLLSSRAFCLLMLLWHH
jgi:hypothetical protein